MHTPTATWQCTVYVSNASCVLSRHCRRPLKPMTMCVWVHIHDHPTLRHIWSHYDKQIWLIKWLLCVATFPIMCRHLAPSVDTFSIRLSISAAARFNEWRPHCAFLAGGHGTEQVQRLPLAYRRRPVIPLPEQSAAQPHRICEYYVVAWS